MHRRPTLPGRNRRLAASTLLATLAAVLVAVPASAAPPSPTVSAWVVARQPGVTTAYTPGPKDQGNSTGGSNTVKRTGIGLYTVKLAGLNNHHGNIQITPLTSQPRWCVPVNWGLAGTDVSIDVRCTAANGSPASSKFVLTFTAGTGGHGSSPGRLGYAWTDDSATPGTPSTSFQHTSAGSVVALAHTGTGRYTVTLPNMGVAGGNVQVTSYGTAATCRPLTWAVSGSDKVIKVACSTPGGADVDTLFDVLFLSRLGPEGFGGGPAAYLWANKPRAASYQPAAATRYNSKGKGITVMRAAKGNYTVVLTGMPAGGAVIVSAQGAAKNHCQLSSLGSVVPMKANVRCYTATGAATDSPFTLAYTK